MAKEIYLIYCDVCDVEDIAWIDLLKKEKKVDNVFEYIINELISKNSQTIKYYNYFDKYKTTKKLEKIISDINNDNFPKIGLLTNKKDLFEFFDGEIHVTNFRNHFFNLKDTTVIDSNTMIYNFFDSFCWSKKIGLSNSLSVNTFFLEHLFRFLKYYEVFNINIKLLTKNTNYPKVKNLKELCVYIQEDIKIFINDKYNIFTSRLGIVLIRLFSFNLNQSGKSIGKKLRIFFNMKSASYRYNFDNKIIRSDLTNKSFRGYKIKYFLNEKDEFRAMEQIEIFNKLKKHNVEEHILKEAFGFYKFTTIKQQQKYNKFDY